MTTHSAALRTLLEPVVGDAGLVLEDVVVTTVGRRRLVRLVVDLPEDRIGSVDLDRVAAVSRGIGDRLDEADAMGSGEYALEVTTPGVDRPLTERRHFSRARTRRVRVQRTGNAEVVGRLLELVEDGPVLEVDGSRVTVPWAEVASAVVEVEFNRRPVDEAPQDVDPGGTVDEIDDDERGKR